jgi:hypothetical protein
VKNIYQTCPKRLRSSPGSKIHPRSACPKALQNVQQGTPAVHDMARVLSHASKLFCAPRAAPQSTLIPGTDPARLKPTACTSPDQSHMSTAQLCTTTGRAARQPKGPHMGGSHSTRRHARSKRTASARSGHQGQPARRPSTRSPPAHSNERQLLLAVVGLKSTAPGRS